MRFLYCLFLVLLFASPVGVRAASLYFDPGESSLSPGDTVVVAVRLNTEPDECINIVDAVISYDPAVPPVDISRGQSILPLWVEEPTINTENNTISFAGGIPNGYCGRVQGDPRLTNEILKIVFQVPGLRIGYGDSSPTTTVSFAPETAVYLNDGFGTRAEVQTVDATFVTSRTPGAETKNEWSRLITGDSEAPSQFSITLVQDDGVFSGKYYIVFNTTDKQTGIDHYEIMEEPLTQAKLFVWGGVQAPWVRARSPYVLEDQSLNSTIRVKAVDKSGNEYVATFVPEEVLRTTSLYSLAITSVFGVAVLLTVMLVFVLMVYWFRRRRSGQKTNAPKVQEEGEEEVANDEGVVE